SNNSSLTDMDPTTAPDAPIYTAVSSKVFYPFSKYNISVFVEPNSNPTQPLRISATISSEKERILSEEIQILPGQARVLQIEVGNVKEREYNLTITVFDPREKKYESQEKIFASRRDKSILIQTDKPIYKPGETVRFRVVLLDRELKPLGNDQTVDLRISDGQRNLIKKIEDLSIQDGFYKNELELSKEPILGDWTIEVQLKTGSKKTLEEEAAEEIQQVMTAEANTVMTSRRFPRPRPRPPVIDNEDVTQKSVSFSVDQYVLPKYKVSIKPPAFLTFKDFKFPVTVEAKYTYGKGVVGECTLVIKKAYFYRYSDEKEEIVSRTFPLNGTHTVDVDIGSLFKKKDEQLYEQDVKLEASVTEDVTGKLLKGESSVRIHKNEYKITQVKQTEKIKPGLPYSTIIKVTTQDDIPVPDPSPMALKVKHGFSFDKESGSFSTSIPPSGLVSMTFPTPTNELIQAQRIELKYKDLKTSFHMPGLYQSTSGTYMQVKRMRRSEEPVQDELTDPIATVKSAMTININATKPFQTFSYIIHGHQDILAAATVNLPQPTTDYKLDIMCPEKAEPEARMIVYTVLSETREILADSLKFQARKLEQDNYLNVTLSEETREPGQNVTLKLNSLPGSRVALRAVDQSVLLLKEDKDITQGTLDEEVKNRENEAHWLNRNWGGSDAFKIFEDGGLVIITNANINAKEQPEYGHFAGSSHHKVAAFALHADSAVMTRAGSHDVQGTTSAEIELDNSEGKFEFAEEKSRTANKQTKTISLSANGVSSVKFAIIPKQFGFVALNVKGYTATAGDALSQPLRVVPPGHRQQRATAALVKPASASEAAEAHLEAAFPEHRVEGADSLKLTLISDILGPTIKNMDKLLQLPTGCGEQNMMSFVADIVILNYLQAAGSLDDEVRTKAIKYLETGYQRQLTYRRYDGSFSAFGEHDSVGSTWLTAFVVRSFIQAKPYITVDDDVIKNALEFLAKQQSPAGGFFEPGRVFQKSLQGGSHSNGIALTAYTLLAFIEARDNWDAPHETAGPPEAEVIVDRVKINGDIVNLAINFVTEKTTSGEIDDVYALVISTYAATLAKHSRKDELFGKLETAGKKDQGLMYWEVEKKNVTDNTTEEKRYIWDFATQPVSVEMTSYALLTYILRGEAPAAFPLVRWLLNKRTANGGFLSTQDTVVGLTALSKYAELTKGAETNLKVDYSAGSVSKNVAINARNADVLQEYELPQEVRIVDVRASGKGTVLAQLSWIYYVEDAVKEPAFSIKVDTTPAPASGLNLNVCTAYLKEGASNMAIVEVNLPSGYTFEPESLSELRESVQHYKRHDVENQNTKLQIYLDSLSSEETCIPLVANRIFSVGKQAPAYSPYPRTPTLPVSGENFLHFASGNGNPQRCRRVTMRIPHSTGQEYTQKRSSKDCSNYLKQILSNQSQLRSAPAMLANTIMYRKHKTVKTSRDQERHGGFQDRYTGLQEWHAGFQEWHRGFQDWPAILQECNTGFQDWYAEL
ncbi:unnamed protein product, partial [Allacma fusca]